MLELVDLNVHFDVTGPAGKRLLRAVNDVSFTIPKGTALGLVGESGSGKSTIGKAALHLVKATSGTIRIGGRDVTGLDRSNAKWLRRTAQIVFQDPHSALNPRRTIFASIAEPLILHTAQRGAELRASVTQLGEIVGLREQFLYRYPHELSGGQKQRVCIARALALEPALLILDEPTSALDVSVQAQVLEFLKSLQTERDLTYLFISHNLAVIRAVCSHVAVLYLGRIVEFGAAEQIFTHPRHPYTKALLASVPHPASRQPAAWAPLNGEIPSPVDLPKGCSFFSRCPRRKEGICDQSLPPLAEHEGGGEVRCFDPINQRLSAALDLEN